MNSSSLSGRIQHLNTVGGFNGALNHDKIAEVATRVSEEKLQKLLQDLEEQKDTINDPTAWITSALRKAGGAQGGDKQLRQRIGWLNGDGGGFNGAIIYDKVVAAAQGLPDTLVMKVLQELEEKSADVKDPNAWVCAALRKAGGGGPQIPQVSFGGCGGWPPSGGYEFAMFHGGYGSDSDRGFDSKVRKRINWLNGTGGFADALTPTKIEQAASGIATEQVLKILKDVEEKKETVKDPLAYVTAALRKLGGGTPSGGFQVPMFDKGSGLDGGLHSKVRKRINWLNGTGGFADALTPIKIEQAASGIATEQILKILKDVEEKKETVKDPLSYVTAALRKLGGGSRANIGMMPSPVTWSWPPMPVMPWAGGGWVDGYDAPSPMELDRVTYSKLHKRVKWLNGTGGFGDALIFEKIAEAATGLDGTSSLKILKDLEENRDKVKDPNAYVTSALRKAGGGSKRHSMGGKGLSKGTSGVRRTISKVKHRS